jgi:small subunit ribosomal protein S9
MHHMAARYYEAVGRRKTASARVRLYPGTGKIIVNDKELQDYFPRHRDRLQLMEPLEVTGNVDSFNVTALVKGGGITGQAGAIRLGIARALLATDENLRKPLRSIGCLTRDSRMKERKKYGLKRARKAPQYTKR